MLWSEEISFEIVNFSNYHIHTKIWESNTRVWWLLTGFYSIPETSKRVDSWDLLGRINQEIVKRWCVIGDFNEITI